MFDLEGMVVLVTGGNRGIGLGMAHGLAASGADVCIWGRDAAANAAAVDELRTHGTRVDALVCDVADEAAVVATFAETVTRFGKVDSCFANAGAGFGLSPFVDLDLAQWHRTLAVNLDGTMLTLREAARHMVARGEGGSLVGVSSTGAMYGCTANEAYSVAKAGIIALVRGLAVELARYGIRCNTILPGWTETEMTEPARGSAKFLDATMARTPARRWAVPADLAPAAVFLAGKEPLVHTGDELLIDGAYTKF
jgi:NAD(P)-dependent dehydrogenase (short-subunit alcohol dehydrogenase family)